MTDLQLVRAGMEIVGSDDVHVGMVGSVAGDQILLASRDSSEDGGKAPLDGQPSNRHRIPADLIDRLDGDRVILRIDAARAAILDALGE